MLLLKKGITKLLLFFQCTIFLSHFIWRKTGFNGGSYLELISVGENMIPIDHKTGFVTSNEYLPYYVSNIVMTLYNFQWPLRLCFLSRRIWVLKSIKSFDKIRLSKRKWFFKHKSDIVWPLMTLMQLILKHIKGFISGIDCFRKILKG